MLSFIFSTTIEDPGYITRAITIIVICKNFPNLLLSYETSYFLSIRTKIKQIIGILIIKKIRNFKII